MSTSVERSPSPSDASKTSKKPMLMSINNVVYDVSSWVQHHPGGDAITKWEGKDATDVFAALHDPATFKKLDAFKAKQQDAITTRPSRSLRFEALKLKLQKLGLFTSNPYWMAYKTITTIAFVFLGIALVFLDQSILGAISMGIGFQQLGWLAHDYCHHSVLPNRKWNRWMGYLTGNLLQGFSQRWWNDRHNAHHASTNVLEADPDIDNLPLFVWSVHDIKRVPTWFRSWLKYQQYYFIFPFCPTLRLIWNLQSIFFVKNLGSSDNSVYRKSATIERVTLALHWIWYFVVFYYATNKFWFFVLSQGIPGFGIAIIVFFNHYACYHFQDNQENFDFLDLQLRTTRDMDPGPITDWICGGLNYQIEHHLFPFAPRHSFSEIQKHVKKFCEEESLPYQSADFITGVNYLLTQLATVTETMEKVKSHDQ